MSDLHDRFLRIERTDPTVASISQIYRRGELTLVDALRLAVVTVVDQRDAIQAKLLELREQIKAMPPANEIERGPSLLGSAAEQLQAAQQAAIRSAAQAVSMPRMLIDPPSSYASAADDPDIHQ